MQDIFFHFRAAKILARVLDSQFKLGRFRFGIDPLIGLIPGIGDLVSVVLSFYIVWIAIRARVPGEKIAQMFGNIVYDFLIGIIPVLGDLADVVFKANERNIKILEEFIPSHVQEGEILGAF